ncbi:MAG: RNA 2',3'-cyclic phosphodiesterase [Anaerolineaceae bacterium]|jgi:2'-5' RNA ligase
MDSIRTFIALELPAFVHEELSSIILHLKQEVPSGIRWVPANNIHITLKFLGDVSKNNLAAIDQAVESIAKGHSAFDIHLGNLGAFPNLRRPRVIWIGIQAPDTLVKMVQEIDQALVRLGYPSEGRPFSPHLTLGRVAQDTQPQELESIARSLSTQKVAVDSPVLMEQVTVFKSELRPSGAMYTPLYRHALKTVAISLH